MPGDGITAMTILELGGRHGGVKEESGVICRVKVRICPVSEACARKTATGETRCPIARHFFLAEVCLGKASYASL